MNEKRLRQAKRYKLSEWKPEMIRFISAEASKIAGFQQRDIDFKFFDVEHLYFEIGWAVGCNLNVHMDSEIIQVEAEDEPNGESNYERLITIRCELSWSSCHRSVANSFAAIELYRQVANLGAMIQARFNDEYYYDL